MEYHSPFGSPYSKTPTAFKLLLLFIALSSLLSPWLIPYLALSLRGIEHGFIWQFLTYSAIHPFPTGIFQLILNLYLIWTFGSSLIERLKIIPFFILYFGATVVSGVCSFLGMYFTHTLTPLMGSSSVLLSLLVAWVLLNAHAQLLLFFTLPFKARNLVLAFIGVTLVLEISNAQWISLISDMSSIVFSYLFILITCRTQSNLSFLRKFEEMVLRTIEKLGSLGRRKFIHTKIYDIESGAPILKDDQFMDAMLARISLYGEDCLNEEEKKRMNEISKKKHK